VIRTRAGYLESIRDGRRVVWGGQMVADVTTHSETRAYAEAVAARSELDDPEWSALAHARQAASALGGALAPAALRVVREDADGIVCSGWTAVVPAAPFAHRFAARVRREPDDRLGEALVALVPAAHPCVTLFVSRSQPAGPGEATLRYPGSELTVVAYFEDVHVPWMRVYVTGDRRPGAAVEGDLLQTRPGTI
jgi:aromatic ring hydroxylase